MIQSVLYSVDRYHQSLWWQVHIVVHTKGKSQYMTQLWSEQQYKIPWNNQKKMTGKWKQRSQTSESKSALWCSTWDQIHLSAMHSASNHLTTQRGAMLLLDEYIVHTQVYKNSHQVQRFTFLLFISRGWVMKKVCLFFFSGPLWCSLIKCLVKGQCQQQLIHRGRRWIQTCSHKASGS